MRLRSRILLVAGLACLSTGVLAGGALAHGGRLSKLSKGSERGHADLAVQVRGRITGLLEATDTTAGFVTVSASDVTPAPAGLEWTCAIPAGSQSTGLKLTDPVKLRCRGIDGVLTAVKLRPRNHGHHDGLKVMDHHNGLRGRVEVEARGTITAIDTMTPDMMSVTVDPGTTTDKLAPFTCNIGPRTRILGMPKMGDTVKIVCRSRHGALVARKIKEKGQIHPGEIQVEIKAPIDTITPGTPGTISFVGGASCAVADATLLDGLKSGDFVEAKCTGNPLTLTRIHLEGNET